MFNLLTLSKPKKRLLFGQLVKWIECDVEIGDKFMRNKQGNSRLGSSVQSLANILAYHLSGRIEYHKLTNFAVGKRELVGRFKEYRSFSAELGNSLISFSKENIMHLESENKYNIIALMLRFLWKSYVLNVESDLQYEGMPEINAAKLLNSLNNDVTHSDLHRIFNSVSFALNSPLLYTKLGQDVLNSVNLSWNHIIALPLEIKNTLYGDLLELYLRGGISELNFNGSLFTSCKLTEENGSIDIVSSKTPLLCESSLGNKSKKEIYLDMFYKSWNCIRVCSSRDIHITEDNYHLIPYPILCCMVDTGDILALSKHKLA